MNFQASRKKRHAAALRLPGTVIAGTAWRQEKSCRLWRFHGPVSRRLPDQRGNGGEKADPRRIIGLCGALFLLVLTAALHGWRTYHQAFEDAFAKAGEKD